MNGTRAKRISNEMQKVVYTAITRNVDLKGTLVSVVKVNTPDDLTQCRIHLSIYALNKQANIDQAFKDIVEKTKEIRNFVAHNIKFKFVPALKFVLDDQMNEIENLEKAFKKI